MFVNIFNCNIIDCNYYFCYVPVTKKVKQLENLTSNSRLGSTEVIASVSVLITATEDVSGNFTVRPLLSLFLQTIYYYIYSCLLHFLKWLTIF